MQALFGFRFQYTCHNDYLSPGEHQHPDHSPHLLPYGTCNITQYSGRKSIQSSVSVSLAFSVSPSLPLLARSLSSFRDARPVSRCAGVRGQVLAANGTDSQIP